MVQPSRTVVTVGVVVVGALVLLALAVFRRDREVRGAQVPATPDAAVVIVVEDPKLVAYRRFLADDDATLHALRLGCYPKWESYLSWDWPQWLPRAQLDADLASIDPLAQGTASIEADDHARAYVRVVRAELPLWERALDAWKQGGAAYAAVWPSLPASFERLGAASEAWRDAMPAEPPAPVGSFDAARQLCLDGTAIITRIAQARPIDEVTAEAPREAPPTIYALEPPDALRDLGLRCARLGLDLLEDGDRALRAPIEGLIGMGLLLVDEEDNRSGLRGAYVTRLGNYAQLASYAVRDR